MTIDNALNHPFIKRSMPNYIQDLRLFMRKKLIVSEESKHLSNGNNHSSNSIDSGN